MHCKRKPKRQMSRRPLQATLKHPRSGRRGFALFFHRLIFDWDGSSSRLLEWCVSWNGVCLSCVSMCKMHNREYVGGGHQCGCWSRHDLVACPATMPGNFERHRQAYWTDALQISPAKLRSEDCQATENTTCFTVTKANCNPGIRVHMQVFAQLLTWQ